MLSRGVLVRGVFAGGLVPPVVEDEGVVVEEEEVACPFSFGCGVAPFLLLLLLQNFKCVN